MASLSSVRENRDLNILAARRFIGTARADISCLAFFQGRQRDHLVVYNLLRVFSQNGCLRHDPDNYVPVLITDADLKKALRASGLGQSALRHTAQEQALCFLKTSKKLCVFQATCPTYRGHRLCGKAGRLHDQAARSRVPPLDRRVPSSRIPALAWLSANSSTAREGIHP